MFIYLGTDLWSAPEVHLDESVISIKADIFSFGLVIYEMIALQPPHTLNLDVSSLTEDSFNESQENFNESKENGFKIGKIKKLYIFYSFYKYVLLCIHILFLFKYFQVHAQPFQMFLKCPKI